MSWVGHMVMPQLPDGRDVQRNLLRILLVTSRSWGLVMGQHADTRPVHRSVPRQMLSVRRNTRLPYLNSAAPQAGLRWAW